MSIKSIVLLLALTLTPASSLLIYPEVSLSEAGVEHADPPAIASSPIDDTPLPLVIWHGLGDRFDADGLNEVIVANQGLEAELGRLSQVVGQQGLCPYHQTGGGWRL